MREFSNFLIDPLKSRVSRVATISMREDLERKKISADPICSLRYIKQGFDPLVYH